MQNNSLKKLVLYFNGFQFFFSLLWWVPIFYAYQKRLGLTDPEIFKIQSWYYLIFCLFEIPTGYLADRFNYRVSLKLGAIVLIIANALVPFFGNYWGFFWHFTLIALSRSLISGASSAYLYDAFKKNGLQKHYKATEGKARAYSLIGKILCWGLVGVLMNYHFTLPYWLTTLNAIIATAFAWLLPQVEQSHKDTQNFGTRFLTLLKILAQSPYLIFIMAQGVAIFVLTRIAQVNLFQPILQSKHFEVTAYGIVMAGMTLMEALGSYYPNWLRRYLKDVHTITILTLAIAFSFIIMALPASFGKISTLFAYGLFSYAVGLSYPVQRQLMNDAIPNPEYRASLLSVESLIDRAINSVVAYFLGSTLVEGLLNSFLIHAAGVTVMTTLLIAFGLEFYRKKGGHRVH